VRIVALLGIRNEERYLRRCLEHLISQGIETCVIDNGSVDSTLDIARAFFGHGVIRIDSLPYEGYFDLEAMLTRQELLARELDADWFIHHDADEIRDPPAGFASLAEAIVFVDAQGFNAIDFEEFVFLPHSLETSCEATDYVADMRHYYFFQPRDFHRINAWRKTADARLVPSAGHQVEFEGRKVFPEKFVLRHYIALSNGHFRRKYGERIYSERLMRERGWHRARDALKGKDFTPPASADLKTLSPGSKTFDRSDPKRKHLFME
jgi:glycosyltransferase involved in cell wall biosynthesis